MTSVFGKACFCNFFDFHIFQIFHAFFNNFDDVSKKAIFLFIFGMASENLCFLQRAHRNVFNLLLLNERSIPHTLFEDAKTEVLVPTQGTSNPTAEEPPTILQRRYTAELNLQRRHRPQQDSKTYSGHTASTGRICHRKMSESIYIFYIYIFILAYVNICAPQEVHRLSKIDLDPPSQKRPDYI